MDFASALDDLINRALKEGCGSEEIISELELKTMAMNEEAANEANEGADA